jgi:ribosomal protein L18E
MRAGPWSSEEENRLVQIMEDLQEDGKSTQTSTKFWKEVAERMDHMRTAHQCRNKWYVSSILCWKHSHYLQE